MFKYTDFTEGLTFRYNTFYLAYVMWLEHVQRNFSAFTYRVTIGTL